MNTLEAPCPASVTRPCPSLSCPRPKQSNQISLHTQAKRPYPNSQLRLLMPYRQ